MNWASFLALHPKKLINVRKTAGESYETMDKPANL